MIDFFPDSKTFIQIFGLGITWYAVFIISGALVAYGLSIRNFKKRGYDVKLLDDLFYGVLLVGVLGARLWYIMFYDFQYYLNNPLMILNFRSGGLAIHGGLILGVAYAYWFIRRRGYSFIRLGDEIVYNILIAQAIGRWGNFMNQEAFGEVVDASYFNNWPQFIADGMFVNGQYHQPTFLFESILNTIGWIVIHFGLRKSKTKKEGDLIWAYVLWYGVVRFFIEGLRTDSLMFGPIRIAQLISILMIVVGLGGFFGLFRKIFKASKPAIIVDFDGTVANTKPLIQTLFREIFESYQMELTQEQYDGMVGPTLEQTFSKYLPEEDSQMLCDRFRARNIELHPQMFELMPNAKETFEQLKKQGYTLAIASNKKTEIIQLGLKLGDMEGIFELVVGSDLVKQVKPHRDMIDIITDTLKIKKDNMIYIGDTITDMQTAKNVNAYAIGYSQDESVRQQLLDNGANAVIGDWSSLLSILEEEKTWIYNTMS